MRTLIFGANGQLGRDCHLHFADAGEIRGLIHRDGDITNRGQVDTVVADFKPDFIVNAAAYTNVEGAEDDISGAFAVNEAGARNVADAAAAHGAAILHFSTDYVFDGRKRTPYEPDDAVAPVGVYARSKWAGEEAVRAANPRHFILRTAWLYGPGGNNFVEKILRTAQMRPSLRVVDDEVGSPTHTYDLAEAAVALAKTDAYGTYHGANRGACSRFGFAKAILAAAGLDTPVEPCASTEFPTKAERPLYSVLSAAKLEAATGYKFRTWQDALTHYFTRRTPT